MTRKNFEENLHLSRTLTQALLGLNTAVTTFLNWDSKKLVDVIKIRKKMVERLERIQLKQKEYFDK